MLSASIKSIIFACILLLNSTLLNAQEFNAKINVQIDPKLNSASLGDKRIFETLRKSIFEFLNNYKWTTDAFARDERIDCTYTFTIVEYVQPDYFKGTLQIQYRRPVLKSDYMAPVFNYIDEDISFRYVENESMDFADNNYISELSSIIGYYSYMILGMDYDTFSQSGGTPYYQKARVVMNNAQNAKQGGGWSAFDGKKSNQNRYWLVENLLNPQFMPLRDCLYQYHLQGLDKMYEQPEAGRGQIFESIQLLQKVHKVKPMSFNVFQFFFAKRDEIVGIFMQGNPQEKSQLYALLSQIDPTNISKYQQFNK